MPSGSPMAESRELAEARRRLAAGEARFAASAGLSDLGDGLALLEDVLTAGREAEARTARNLAASYAARVYGRVAATLADDRGVTEPLLEHFFKLMLAFDGFADALPPDSRALKVDVVRRLIERYCEGHPPEKKARMLEQLEQVYRAP